MSVLHYCGVEVSPDKGEIHDTLFVRRVSLWF